MAKKSNNTKKLEVARQMYISGMQINTIAKELDVARQTIGEWAKKGQWDELKISQKVTRPMVVNNILAELAKALANGTASADYVVKMATSIEKISPKLNIVTIMDVFTKFSDFLLKKRSLTTSNITLDFIKQVTNLQNQFVSEYINSDE